MVNRLTIHQIYSAIDRYISTESGLGVRFENVTISLPLPHKGLEFDIPGFRFRNLEDLVRYDVEQGRCRSYMTPVPCKLYMTSKLPGHSDAQLYDEIYHCNKMNKEYEKVMSQKRVDDLPVALYGLMLYSDGTSLADTGNASAWVAYGFSANIAKAVSKKASAGAMYLLAFLPSVS